jgi:hypothetical protein
MNFAMNAALFLLGIYLAIRVLAALHRIIDLWYTIGTVWARMLRGVVIWCGGTLAFALLIPVLYRPALLWGFASYVAFYLAAFALWHLMVPRLASRKTTSRS